MMFFLVSVMPYRFSVLDYSEAMKAYRVWRWIVSNKHGLLAGLPGSGKSLYSQLACLYFNNSYKVIYSVPLRQLRDSLYRRIQADERFQEVREKVVLVKAHDEVCSTLARRIKERPNENYFKLLAEHLSAVKQGKEQCNWKKEIRKVMELLRSKDPVFILTTHELAFMLRMITWVTKNRNVLFLFDEAEELFVRLGQGINLADIEVVKDIDKALYRRLKKLYRPLNNNDFFKRGYIFNKAVLEMLGKSIFISASFPPTILKQFELIEDEYPTYTFRTRREKDTIIILNQELHWSMRTEWQRKLYPQLLEIVRTATELHGAVGVVSRNYAQTEALEKLFESAGFSVWSDRKDDNSVDYRDAEVVIITTMGKGYRGVSLFTKRSGQGDFKVIIAFFQAKGLSRANIHPVFYDMLVDDPLHPDHDELGDFIEDLTLAKNFQSLFRFNRFRSNKHLLILLDKRWWKALTTYAWKYFFDANRIDVDIDNVAQVAVPIIRNF